MTFLTNSISRIALVASFGWCTLASAAVEPTITSPKAGAIVTSPFTVEVMYGDIEQCDTGGCTDVPANAVDLHADPDGEIIFLGSCDAMTECPNGKATFEVTLEPGEHELRATVDDGNFSVAFSEHVKITVEAAATTDAPTSSGGPDTTGADTSTGASTDTSNDGSSGGSKDDGCGCNATSTAEGALGWLAVAVLLFRRRRFDRR
ncbi:MYXO-CTERM sorting domain-containing protein [Nannocystis pusilla]|uniref:MYXO-CTERM sorting domain-containing protein n=1 Tax=Nannocystis pusilla TaxID=889268 RepID=UPI003B793055